MLSARAATLLDAASWTHHILGVSEVGLLEDRARFIGGGADAPVIRHDDGQHEWPAGKFECHAINSLRQQVLSRGKTKDERYIPITVIDGIDIGHLQATLTTDQRAMVQIASNFNALEVPNRDCAPDHGGLVTNYAVDSSQGPAASFGVPAACLLRAHYPFRAEDVDPSEWGQTIHRQIELLSGVRSQFGTAVNGKVTLRGDETPIDSDEEMRTVADRIQVGLHSDAQVIFDRGPCDAAGKVQLQLLPLDRRPLVDQVLAASVNLNSLGVVPQSAERTRWLVRAALRAAYDGAYLTSIVRERRLLVLTLIGGGVFGNQVDDIIEAIAEAHSEWAPHSSLDEVRLCLYQPGTAALFEAKLLARLEDLGSDSYEIEPACCCSIA